MSLSVEYSAGLLRALLALPLSAEQRYNARSVVQSHASSCSVQPLTLTRSQLPAPQVCTA